ncbi:MAG: phosphoribosylanthranilate isomerase [Candidatus Eisenbacteria bacterium]
MKAIKLCGLTGENDVRVARELGAEFAGFVFAESPRRVDPGRAAELRRGFDGSRTRVVGVFAGEDPERIREIVREVRLDLVQLHGGTGGNPCGVPVIRALKVRGGKPAPAPAGERPEWYLLDAYDPVVEGGSGRPFDWGAARSLDLPRPFLLAGGLTAESVGRAIAALRPDGVDVSSGIEENPGVKSEYEMRRFVAAARAAFDEGERE